MPGITRLIIRHFGTLSTNDNNWSRELNLVSWNGKMPKFDLREWSPNKEKSGKGMTFKTDEMIVLKAILNGMTFDDEKHIVSVGGEDAESAFEIGSEADMDFLTESMPDGADNNVNAIPSAGGKLGQTPGDADVRDEKSSSE